jgi:dCMP deaminase
MKSVYIPKNPAKKTPPRKTPTRDERYMGLAFIMGSFSHDPNTQIGSQIVGMNNLPLAWGYNGPPRCIPDDDVDWSRDIKYQWIVHSEINAIYHCLNKTLLDGATIYVTAPPCPRCMLQIVSVGISKVVYFDLKMDSGSSINEDEFKKTEEIAILAKVQLVKFDGNLNWLRDWLKKLEETGVFD